MLSILYNLATCTNGQVAIRENYSYLKDLVTVVFLWVLTFDISADWPQKAKFHTRLTVEL
jgi:hypothetical protein